MERDTGIGPASYPWEGYVLVTVLRSNLSGLDDYIKQYLQERPDLSIGTQLKIILRELIDDDLILQLDNLKSYLEIASFQ